MVERILYNADNLIKIFWVQAKTFLHVRTGIQREQIGKIFHNIGISKFVSHKNKKILQGATESIEFHGDFFSRNNLAIIKLRVDSASFASYCRKIASLIILQSYVFKRMLR